MTTSIQYSRRFTLAEAFQRAVAQFPNKEALVFERRRWTYRQVDKAVQQIALYLKSKGLKAGDHVAAYGANSDAYVLYWLACNRLGLVHVPVNYALLGDELHYILTQSKAKAVFCDPHLKESLANIQPRLNLDLYGTFFGGEQDDILSVAAVPPHEPATPGSVVLEDIRQFIENTLPMGDTDDVLLTAFDEKSPAQILYTSGTTSLPKGAMLSHEALYAEYMSAIEALDIKPSDKALTSLPLYHSAQMQVFLMPGLLQGVTQVIIPAPKPDVCFLWFEKENITTFFAPPTVWISLLRHPEFSVDKMKMLKKAYYGASIMPLPVLEEIRQLFPEMGVYNCYGQSEIGPLATVLNPAEHLISPASAGRPVMNVMTRVVDDKMNTVPVGQVGEIVHQSKQLMSGYWDKPEQTEESFEGGWFHSGDMGYFDEHGFLYIVDRIKDVINTGGVLVSSRDVEECLYKHPSVAEVAVIAIPDEKWVEAVCAVVTLKAGTTATEQELINFAKERIAPFKVPKKVHFKDELPRNTAGKLLKRTLREEFAS
ncbi:fatty acyl-CoA synthetase [Pelistega suis]|uniref:Long-chain-fatty-acid--CoA ligase n=1 Tax=Pelistega suis TaxID=1631957 RepID=A0A849P5N5_9BURK|nr:fatty acyl-CoA synthetase [Pelistega suis]NOL52426.1 long-chain-fatty-acid--CoA ligase [Pelistega suis]